MTFTHKTAVLTLLLTIAVGIGACGGSDDDDTSSGSDELVINFAGGPLGDAIQTSFDAPFESETGIDVIFDPNDLNQGARLKAQAAAGDIRWDVIGGYPYGTYQPLYEAGLLREIDYEEVGSGADGLSEAAKQPWGLGYEYNTYVLAYDKTAVDAKPKSVGDFFDPETYPGPRTMPSVDWGTPQINFGSALTAAGVAPADQIPIDYDTALGELDKVKDSIAVYYDSGSEIVTSLIDGRATICLCTDGRALQAQKINENIEVVWTGAIRELNYMGAVADSPNSENVEPYFAQRLDPEGQAAYAVATGYSGTNPKSSEHLPEGGISGELLANPKNLEETYEFTQEQNEWIADNQEAMTERLATWVGE